MDTNVMSSTKETKLDSLEDWLSNFICPLCSDRLVLTSWETEEGDWVHGYLCNCDGKTRELFAQGKIGEMTDHTMKRKLGGKDESNSNYREGREDSYLD